MTAHPYDQSLLAPSSDTRDLRGVALVVVLLVLMMVAGAVLATTEWIAPASSAAVPG